MKTYINTLIILISIVLASCSISDRKKSNKIADYPKQTENITLKKGILVCDTLGKNIHTHSVSSGDKYVVSFKRTGVTINDAEDWDTKYEETLVFQIDTTVGEFEYQNIDLEKISCKYYWICYSKEIKKEIVKIDNGTINGQVFRDSLIVEIDVNTEFGFGSLLEKNSDKKIKINKTFEITKE